MYDDLSPLQWVCGFLRSILKQPNPQAQRNMTQYGADLVQNALDLGWPTAKGSYKVLLATMESTPLDWDNLPDIQNLRHQYAQRSIVRNAHANSSPAPSHSNNQATRPSRRLLCARFQTNNCNFESDHTADGVRYRHICSFCFHNLGKAFPHRESDCQNKRRRGNGQGGPPPQ